MSSITALLIEPSSRSYAVIQFKPTLEFVQHLLGTDDIIHFVAATYGWSCTAADHAQMSYVNGQPAEAFSTNYTGAMIVTGPVDAEGRHTDMAPAALQQCINLHTVGWEKGTTLILTPEEVLVRAA